ncbi:hypothetical protein ACE1TI_07450 [Alteribacillus sp. JSM 102045]|uniref:hypothetical protein n=1 Tax=Alteribacillus sp. JSM 102045 TaxID=1562101 RepID=UPI0035C0ED18
MMQAAEQFGNAATVTGLSPSKIYKMLTLPAEVDRAEFIEQPHVIPETGEEKTVHDMTTRELEAVVKAEKQPDKPMQAQPDKQARRVTELPMAEAVKRVKPSLWAQVDDMTVKELKMFAVLSHTEQERCLNEWAEKYQAGGLLEFSDLIGKYVKGISEDNFDMFIFIAKEVGRLQKTAYVMINREVSQRLDKVAHGLDELFNNPPETDEELNKELKCVSMKLKRK